MSVIIDKTGEWDSCDNSLHNELLEFCESQDFSVIIDKNNLQYKFTLISPYPEVEGYVVASSIKECLRLCLKK